MSKKVLTKILFLTAIVLAVSFILPVASNTTYVDSTGKPVGLLGQIFPNNDSIALKDYSYFWKDFHPVLLILFFVPVILEFIRLLPLSHRMLFLLDLISPLASLGFLPILIAAFVAAKLEIFPLFNTERAYGIYVALIAACCYSGAALIRAGISIYQRLKNQAIRADRNVSPATV